MKKIIAIILTTVMLLSMVPLTALGAAAAESAETNGPADTTYLYGGARLGVFDTHTEQNKYVLNFDYEKGSGFVINNNAVAGMTYDLETNTLTIENVHQRDNELFIWYMGNDFKLNVKGENEFGVVYVYNAFGFHNTSLNIIGDGTLIVNEDRSSSVAIQMVAEGDAPVMGLDIADTVTVHLYSAEGEEGEEPNPVVGLSATSITPEQGGAITVGGKALAEAGHKQVVEQTYDTVSTVNVTFRDEEFVCGTQITSKTDPNSVYALAEIMDGATYIVQRYMYSEELGLWVVDRSFSEDGFVGKRYTKEEFEAAYDYVYGMAPARIQFMEAFSVDNRGYSGTKMIKDCEPYAVYVGMQYGGNWDWGDDENYTGGYTILRVVWDENQEMYVEDTSFERVNLMAGELEENGYHIVKETVDEPLELTVWTSEDPSDNSRYELTNPVLIRKSDPDGLYIQRGTYTTGDGESGISICKVHYNPATDEHYIVDDSYSPPEYFLVTNDDIESGESDFSYDVEAKIHHVKLRYLSDDYDIGMDTVIGTQLKKNDDPDGIYAYTRWTHYLEDETVREEYGIVKLQYSDKAGCYYLDKDFDEVEFYDPDDLDRMGYTVVCSEQPLDFLNKGRVELEEYPIYTDKGGTRYYVDYLNDVYAYTDEDVVILNGVTYHYGYKMPNLTPDDLKDTIHEVVTDNYSYWIPGTEYHHAGGVQPYVEYPIWVNGEQLNSDRLMIPCGSGSAVYDPVKNTLTLDNAEITKGAEKDWTYSGVLSQMERLTVVIKGNCTITDTNGDGIGTYNSESYQIGEVIYPAPYDLTITGDGILTINESTPVYGYGLYCTGNLVIDGVTLDIHSAAAGVWASDLKMNNVKADIETSSWYSGIVINRGNFTFDNSSVTALSKEGSGLLLGNDQDNSTLTVNSGSLSLSGKLGVQGVVDTSVVRVDGGTLSVTGTDAAFDDTYLVDDAKYILMGEGIGVVSGDIYGKSVVISEKSGPILGDADDDGELSIIDATFIQAYLAQIPQDVAVNEQTADVDGNKLVEILDATYIRRYLDEMETPYPIGEPIQ